VKTFENLFGSKHCSYNGHGLLHLAKDTESFGTLDCFSAFRFENRLGQIKRLLSGTTNPLSQVHRRLAERKLAGGGGSSIKSFPKFKYEHCEGPILGDQFSKQYKFLALPNFTIRSDKFADSVVLLVSNQVLVVKNILEDKDENTYLCGFKFK